MDFERLSFRVSLTLSVRQSCGGVGRRVEGHLESEKLEQRHRYVKVQILVRDEESPVEEMCVRGAGNKAVIGLKLP